MKPFPPLEQPLTDGVVALRRWRADDADDLVVLADDPLIVRWTTVSADSFERSATGASAPSRAVKANHKTTSEADGSARLQ